MLHFAAKIAAGESRPAGDYWRTNVGGTLALLDAVRRAGVPRLVFSSTAAVYGNPAGVPITETAARPDQPVRLDQARRRHGGRARAAAHGLGAVSLRYFNVAGAAFGTGGVPLGERHNPETHLIPLALQVAAGRTRRSCRSSAATTRPATAPASGTTSTSRTSPPPICWPSTRSSPARHRIYNLGNGNGFSNLQVVDVVRAVTGAAVPVVPAPRRPGDPAALVAGSARARAELGWVPTKPDLRSIVRRRLDVLPRRRRRRDEHRHRTADSTV